jgi:hypothetical protein
VKSYIKYSVLFLILVLFSTCKKAFAPAEDAFFITAGEVKVATQAGQGFGSHKITDLWVYSNGIFRGAYPVGAKMPFIIKDGKATVDVFAGIMNNGIPETRINWLLYEPVKFDTSLKSGENIVRNFTFKYREPVKFLWVENFELPGFSLVRSSNSDTTFKVNTNNEHVFEGNRSVEFGLTGNSFVAQVESATSYSVPMSSGSGNVYLELDYKCNTEFEIGILSNGLYSQALVITPKENWNHIYVQLSTAVNADPSTPFKKIALRIRRNSSISAQKVYFDNVKFVYL